MRSRSRTQRPRTGSLSAAKSAGTGQGKVPNAGGAGRSPRSGRPAWPGGKEGAPWGGRVRWQAAEGAARSAAQPGHDGRWRPRGRAGEKDAAGGAPSRQGATPRRDPGDCNDSRLPNRSVKRARRASRAGCAQSMRPGNKTPREDQQGRCRTWGRGKGRRRPCPSAEGKDAGGVTGLGQRNALARRLPTA